MPVDLARQIVAAHADWFGRRGYDTGDLGDV